MEAQEKGNVSLREYLDMQIAFINKELAHVRDRIAHEKEIYNKDSEAIRLALEEKAEEYEKHLAALNNEAKRLSQMVTKEMFDVERKAEKERYDRLDKEITILRDYKSKQEGKAAISSITSIIGLLIAIGAFLFSIYKNNKP